MSGLTFADGFVGDIRNTRLVAETNKRRRYNTPESDGWRRSVKKCTVVVCIEDRVNPVNFSWKVVRG